MEKRYNPKTRVALSVFGMISIVIFIDPVMTLLPKFVLIFPIVVWLFLAYLYDRKIMTKILFSKSMFFSYIYIVVIIGNFIWGRSSLNAHDIILVPIVILSLYYLELKDFVFLRYALRISVIYYTMISFYSLIRFTSIPSLARILASGSDKVFREYGNSFTATYATAYSLVGLVPLVFVFGKMHKKYSISYLIGLFGLLVIFRCQYTTGVILALGFSIMYIVAYSTSGKNIHRWILLLLVCMLCVEYAPEIVAFMMNHLHAATLRKRFAELLLIIQNGGLLQKGDFANRVKYLTESLNSFRQNPLFGVGFQKEYFMKIIGGHSTFIDIFGKYGLLGGIPYLGIFYSVYMSYIKDVDRQYKIIFYIIMLQYTLLNILNTSENVGLYISYYCLIPLLVLYESRYTLIPIRFKYGRK